MKRRELLRLRDELGEAIGAYERFVGYDERELIATVNGPPGYCDSRGRAADMLVQIRAARLVHALAEHVADWGRDLGRS